jgi:hypothetical protein
LQLCILELANEREKVRYRDILTRYYGWKPRYGNYGHCFSRKEIGAKRYSSAMAALSKACARLSERGLVEWYMIIGRESFVEITEAGRELMANRQTKCPCVSH